MPTQLNGNVELPPIFDLDSLDQVRDLLASALESGPVAVSGKAVERVATNALFLLLSAAETARMTDRSLTLHTLSDPLSGAMQRLGLTPYFQTLLRAE
jgi:hypothetical protein